MPLTGDPEYRPVWKNRRRVIFGTLILDALVVAAVVVGWFFYGLDISTPFSVVLTAIVARDTAIIASYVFGATWEDIRLWRS